MGNRTDQIWVRRQRQRKTKSDITPPLPIGASRAVWHRKGRGGGHSGGLKDLETGQVTSRAVPVPGPTADPGTQAAMADQAATEGPGTEEAMAERGARAAMADRGTQAAMGGSGGHGGSGNWGGHGGAGCSGGHLSRFTRGSRNEETRIETNRVFNGWRTEEIQEHR